jgi:hypothetical protein
VLQWDVWLNIRLCIHKTTQVQTWNYKILNVWWLVRQVSNGDSSKTKAPILYINNTVPHVYALCYIIRSASVTNLLLASLMPGSLYNISSPFSSWGPLQSSWVSIIGYGTTLQNQSTTACPSWSIKWSSLTNFWGRWRRNVPCDWLLFIQIGCILEICKEYCHITVHSDHTTEIGEYNKLGSRNVPSCSQLAINLTMANIVILYNSNWYVLS